MSTEPTTEQIPIPKPKRQRQAKKVIQAEIPAEVVPIEITKPKRGPKKATPAPPPTPVEVVELVTEDNSSTITKPAHCKKGKVCQQCNQKVRKPRVVKPPTSAQLANRELFKQRAQKAKEISTKDPSITYKMAMKSISTKS